MYLSLFHTVKSSGEYTKEYDFSKINETDACDKITSECQSNKTKLRMLGVLSIVTTIISFYFSFIGASALFAPAGLFAAATTLKASVIVLGCLLLSAIPHYDFLEVTLTKLHSLIGHNTDQMKFSEDRKIELLQPNV